MDNPANSNTSGLGSMPPAAGPQNSGFVQVPEINVSPLPESSIANPLSAEPLQQNTPASVLDPATPSPNSQPTSPFGLVVEETPAASALAEATTPAPQPQATTANAGGSGSPKSKKAVVAGVSGLVLLLFGIGAALVLVRQPQDIREEACGDNCEDNQTTPITASCSEVKVYDSSWAPISTSDLSNLRAGEVVRFTVSGTATAGTFDKARFTINGTQRTEVTAKKPGSNEFYDEYTIPSGQTSFTVEGQVHHGTMDMWF